VRDEFKLLEIRPHPDPVRSVPVFRPELHGLVPARPLAVQIAADLHLSTQQRGLVVATPILAGAVLRFVMGMLADRLSPKTAGLIGQVIVICALFGAWKLGIHSYEQALLLGLFLGMAGASFAVALPLASQWYPPQHQGKAMGIAGAGNSGTVFAALIAPVLAARSAGATCSVSP
jgi:NNP family nitrate/nitrite transporter-like MFS transporter